MYGGTSAYHAHIVDLVPEVICYSGITYTLLFPTGTFHVFTVLSTTVANSVLVALTHSNLPWLDLGFFNTRHHYHHHAGNTACNFAPNFWWVDWVFGTYEDPGEGWTEKSEVRERQNE